MKPFKCVPVTSLSQQLYYLSILQMSKPGLREVPWLVQGHLVCSIVLAQIYPSRKPYPILEVNIISSLNHPVLFLLPLWHFSYLVFIIFIISYLMKLLTFISTASSTMPCTQERLNKNLNLTLDFFFLRESHNLKASTWKVTFSSHTFAWWSSL